MGVLGQDMVAVHLRKSCETLKRATDDQDFGNSIFGIANVTTYALQSGGKILLAGSGGSAGDAHHIAGEFLSRWNSKRNPLPAIALTADTSVLIAIGNDYGYDKVFERQMRGLGKPGDGFIAILTSGRSANVITALQAARNMGITAIRFAGANNPPMRALCDHCLSAPSHETPLIQQIHIVAAHVICGLVEYHIFDADRRRASPARSLRPCPLPHLFS